MSFEEIGSMVTLGLNVFALFTLLFAFLMGLKRGVFKSAVRTVSLFLSALVSLLLVNLFLPSVLSSVANILLEEMGSGDVIGDLMQAQTTFVVLEALIAALVAPMIFLVVYLVVNKIFLIPCFIVNRIFKKRYEEIEKNIPCRRLFGGLIGMVGALVTLVVIATPIGGYTELVLNVSEHIEAIEAAEEDEDIETGSQRSLGEGSSKETAKAPVTNESLVVNPEGNYGDQYEDDNDYEGYDEDEDDDLDDLEELKEFLSFGDAIAVKIPYTLGGKLFFNSLTTLRIEKGGIIDEDIEVTLEHEVIGVINMIPLAESLDNLYFGDIEHMNVEPLRDIVEALSDEDSSEIVRIMLTDIFSTAANKWLDGDTYLSINLMEMLDGDAAMFRPSVELILEDLADTSVSSVGDDILELVETFDSIGQTFMHLSNITDKLSSGQEITVDEVMGMIDTLTVKSAEAMSLSLPSVIEKNSENLGGENAQSISNVLSNALVGMAEMNESNADRAKVEKEAAAVKTVMTAAMSPKDNMTEEEADDLINTVMDSEVLAGSIRDTVNEDDGTSGDMNLSDADKVQVKNKLDAYAQENDVDEDQQATLDALHKFFGTNNISE